MMFGWLKRMVRNAVLDGVNEAIGELAGVQAEEPRHLPEVRLLLPAPVEDEEPSKPARKRG